MKSKQDYFCAGYVILIGDKKGIMYKPYVNGEVIEDENKELIFAVKRHNDYPVGWIINITKTEMGYGNIEYVSGEVVDKNIIDKYQVTSISNSKQIDFENLRKRSKSTFKTIENMTIKELKEYSKDSPSKRRVIKMYLYELF